jgi:hypothetical protein
MTLSILVTVAVVVAALIVLAVIVLGLALARAAALGDRQAEHASVMRVSRFAKP